MRNQVAFNGLSFMYSVNLISSTGRYWSRVSTPLHEHCTTLSVQHVELNAWWIGLDDDRAKHSTQPPSSRPASLSLTPSRSLLHAVRQVKLVAVVAACSAWALQCPTTKAFTGRGGGGRWQSIQKLVLVSEWAILRQVVCRDRSKLKTTSGGFKEGEVSRPLPLKIKKVKGGVIGPSSL